MKTAYSCALRVKVFEETNSRYVNDRMGREKRDERRGGGDRRRG